MITGNCPIPFKIRLIFNFRFHAVSYKTFDVNRYKTVTVFPGIGIATRQGGYPGPPSPEITARALQETHHAENKTTARLHHQ
jgi:hypothetical protein